MKALIISNGETEGIDIKKYFNNSDIVICADGGAKHLIRENLIPNLIVGDLDSLGNEMLKKYELLGVEIKRFPTHKDKTDTELAIEYAIEKGANDILLIGATGSRLDHSLANVMLLYKLVKLNVNIRIVDQYNEIFISNSQLTLNKKEGYYVSIIPLVDSKITLNGFKFNTESVEFNVGSTLGISNVVKENKGTINIEEGICLIIRSKD